MSYDLEGNNMSKLNRDDPTARSAAAAASLSGGEAATAPGENGIVLTSIHSETVILTSLDQNDANAIQSLTYVPNSLVITHGQPSSQPASITCSGTQWTIVLQAGRKGSGDVAASFMTASGGGPGNVCGLDSGGKTPGELNFFFQVTATFTNGAQVVLCLGQGHTDSYNNWWIGSPSIQGGDTLVVGGDQYSINNDSTDYEFVLYYTTPSA